MERIKYASSSFRVTEPYLIWSVNLYLLDSENSGARDEKKK